MNINFIFNYIKTERERSGNTKEQQELLGTNSLLPFDIKRAA
jgi:hypothetical protein